jgi:hypothetical protein
MLVYDFDEQRYMKVLFRFKERMCPSDKLVLMIMAPYNVGWTMRDVSIEAHLSISNVYYCWKNLECAGLLLIDRTKKPYKAWMKF